jgi:hypothetical protein
VILATQFVSGPLTCPGLGIKTSESFLAGSKQDTTADKEKKDYIIKFHFHFLFYAIL